MLVPMSWLREFTPYEGTASQLGDKLTVLGLELEEIVNPFAGIADIKVGFVAECKPHPDSDHMHCCKVDLGNGELADIVCGASNVAQGQKVAVAPVGARLPDGTTIKKAKLRGQPSFGMICSERELGLSEDHGGILVLPESTVTGQPLVAALELDTEVLDLSITPNRADCLSILGIARETATAFKLPLNVPELPLLLDDQSSEINVPIEIEDTERCWLYSGRVISNAATAPSPIRMRYRLHAVGVRAISNIVDVTNYILFEVGQPLHSFDLDKLNGGRIIVRAARPGEKLVTLDGKERSLTQEDLCICDAVRPVGLAGVMGGENTEIDGTSKNVFLESAVFQPQAIRKTARRLALGSEASYRFERGVDQQRTIWALDRACALMASLTGGKVRRGFSCSEPKPFRPAQMSFCPARASTLLGAEIDDRFQEDTLTSLGCSVHKNSPTQWDVAQPSWRPDLTREADLIEEVGRVYGLDAIKPELPPIQRQMNDDLAPRDAWNFWQLVKDWGAGLGLNEAINYSFVGQKDLDFIGVEKESRLAVFNPLSEDQNVLRTCLAPGLLRDLSNNLAFGTQSIKIFELANVFRSDPAAETGAAETGFLGILLSGPRHEQPWPPAGEDLDYADLKGCIEHLARYLHLAKPHFSTVSQHPYLLPCVEIKCGGTFCGYGGRIKPAIAREYNAQKAVWLCELNLETLRQLHISNATLFQALPVYPGVKRDITVIADPQIQVEQILEKIAMLQLPILEGAALVDSFEAAGGNTRERHLTFRLAFRHPSRTLKDAEVDKEREKVADFLRRELGARI